MDIYEIRRVNLLRLIRELKVTYKEFSALTGYKAGYIGQLVNRQKIKATGGEVVVSEKVVGKILASLKNRKDLAWLNRGWFDEDHSSTKLPAARRGQKRTATADPDPDPAQEPGHETTVLDILKFLSETVPKLPTDQEKQIVVQFMNGLASPGVTRTK